MRLKITRRAVLGASVAAVSSGCSGDPPRIDLGGGDCSYWATAEPFDPVRDVPPDYNEYQLSFAHRVIEDGDVRDVYSPKPLKDDSFVSMGESYYRIRRVETSAILVPALVMSVYWRPGQTPQNSGFPVVEFSSLPRIDQAAFRSVVYGGRYKDQVHPETELVHSQSPVNYPGGFEKSELATRDQFWVAWDDRYYTVTIHGTTQRIERVHEYDASLVATGPGQFRTMIKDRYVATLTDAPPEVKEILDSAIDEGYERHTDEPLAAWEKLLHRLPDVDFPKEHYNWYVEYEGRLYLLTLDSGVNC